MADPNDIPRSMKILAVAWPIALAALTVGAASVSANTKADQVATRVAELEQKGAPVIRERLARMEEQQASISKQLDRMENKLDDLDKRSRERNLNGL